MTRRSRSVERDSQERHPRPLAPLKNAPDEPDTVERIRLDVLSLAARRKQITRDEIRREREALSARLRAVTGGKFG